MTDGAVKRFLLHLGLCACVGAGGAHAQPAASAPVSRTVADILQQLEQYKPDPRAYATRLAALNTPAPDTADAAMLALMNDSFADERGRKLYSYAHPMFWAPYALVGDSGR